MKENFFANLRISPIHLNQRKIEASIDNKMLKIILKSLLTLGILF